MGEHDLPEMHLHLVQHYSRRIEPGKTGHHWYLSLFELETDRRRACGSSERACFLQGAHWQP